MNVNYSEMILDKGTGVNEDIGHINKNAAWVLDGATGVTKKHIFKEFDSDAQWFTHRWNEYLKLNIEKDIDLITILKNGVNIIKNEYFEKKGNMEMDNIDYPSSTLALVRWNNKYLEYFILADNIISIECNGNIDTFKDTSLDKFDKVTHRKMHEFILNNDGDLDSAREYVSDILISNRKMKNRKDGYSVLEFDDFAIDNGVYGKIYGTNFNVLLATDGFTALSEKYNQCKLNDLIELADEKGLNDMNKKLREIESKDPKGRMFPRIKVHDDSSAIYLNIAKELAI